MTQLLYDIKALPEVIQTIAPDKVFVLCDDITARLCLPRLCLSDASLIEIRHGDTDKSIEQCQTVWQALVNQGASRASLLINVGGGMTTDLGGFAAATFKRGIRFVQVPTTLLAMVDAAMGGKTGVNFAGLKNEIGVFAHPEAVVVDTRFLETLDEVNIRSGYAEMLKHSLLQGGKMLQEYLDFALEEPSLAQLSQMVAESIQVKQDIVRQDPTERGLRRALNLGHTAGHAFESLLMQQQRPVLHGIAVAWGLSTALYLSTVLMGFPEAVMHRVVGFIRQHYGALPFTCEDVPHLLTLVHHDKKNVGGHTAFTLLSGIGGQDDIRLGIEVSDAMIAEAIDFVREA